MTPGFGKNDRSTFKYWFAHWCAYQMTALNFKVWKPSYLLHDFEKPWLRLVMGYKRVQEIHRRHSPHHLTYKHPDKIDWQALVIDWECSRYTKIASPMTARETYESFIREEGKYPTRLMKENIPPILNKLNLEK